LGKRCLFRALTSNFGFSMPGSVQPLENIGVISQFSTEEMRMRKALAILATVATVGATTLTAPAQARGIGPGLAFGLAAGALAAGVAGAYGPYGYGYGPGYGYYGYYGPRYYAPAYGAYAYYPRYYPHHRYYHHHWRRW
jgi:hypothetical protein